MKQILLSLALCTSTFVSAQETIKLTAGDHNDYGIAYSLPTTLVEMTISSTKHTQKRGPYYLYAEKYLGVKEVITQDEVFHTLDKVSFAPTAEPNTEETFLVTFKADNPPAFYLDKKGLLLAINTEPALHAAKLTPATSTASTDIPPAYTAFNEELIVAGSTAKMAELAAKQIFHIRESRMDLITGNVDQLPADGESFNIIMKQLDEQEKALTELFVGKKTDVASTYTQTINPLDWGSKGIIFRFSKYFGVVDLDDLSGAAYYLKTETLKDLRPKTELEIENNLKQRKKNKGIAYVLPGTVRLKLSSSNKTITSMEMQIAQLGEVLQLPKATFEQKKVNSQATFDPFTGAILELK